MNNAGYISTITWQRNDAPFTDGKYSRIHNWKFDGGQVIPASASSHIVPEPLSDSTLIDPEEALVAALSSCHMLVFLSIAARRGYVVDSYQDRAKGEMAKDEKGKMAINRVTLNPLVTYVEGHAPDENDNKAMHHDAHEGCFIANSVKTEVITIPAMVRA